MIVPIMSLQAAWLLQLARQDGADAKKAFACIPEYTIRDMTGWLSFVIQSGQADLVASCRLDVLIAFLTEMLQRLELVQSPIVHAKIVELLLAMLSPQLGRRRRRGTFLILCCLRVLTTFSTRMLQWLKLDQILIVQVRFVELLLAMLSHQLGWQKALSNRALGVLTAFSRSAMQPIGVDSDASLGVITASPKHLHCCMQLTLG